MRSRLPPDSQKWGYTLNGTAGYSLKFLDSLSSVTFNRRDTLSPHGRPPRRIIGSVPYAHFAD